MAIRKVIILPFAELDIRSSVEHYKEQEDSLDIKFIKAINNTLSLISKNPNAFPIQKNNIRKAVVQVFPFCIYYVNTSEIIYILAVFHDKRNPRVWKHRRPNKPKC